MLETDADRLASIKGAGGQLVYTDGGSDFWAIFDEAGAVNRFDQTHVNSTSPQLTLRTSDVDKFNLAKRAVGVLIDTKRFTVRESQKTDAPGWTVLVLNAS